MGDVVNFKDVKTEKEAKEVTQAAFVELEEKPNIFEAISKEFSELSPGLGGYDVLAAILALEDDQFALMAPIFLEELEKSCNNVNDKMVLAQALNAAGLKVEDLQQEFMEISQSIEKEMTDMPRAKVDFLKQILAITYNAISDTRGIAKRIIEVPVEYCREGAKTPIYATAGSAALDIYSPEEYNIAPGETVIVKTGLKVALPLGYALLVHPRSGLSVKTQLRVPNSIGLIDSDYRDEIGIILQNIEPKIKDITIDENGKVTSIEYGSVITIGKGERIAQMRLVEVPKMMLYEVESVANIGENRGGGFGSTGMK